MNSNEKPVQASFCQQVQTSLKCLTNFKTSGEVGKKSLTKASLHDAPIPAARINSCRLDASLTNMESNKIMGLFLCRVEDNILRVNELNKQLQEALGNQMTARKKSEVKAFWVKEKFQRETEQLKKRFDSISTMKDESNKKLNEKCYKLELRVLEEKQARELLIKELNEEKYELKNVCCERDKLLKACENEITTIKMELQAANNREGVREILIKKLNEEKQDLTNEFLERGGLLKTYETEMESIKADLEDANNKDRTRELLIKKLEDEKKELKNESNKRDELLKENEIQIESFKFELEAANNREQARELKIKELEKERKELTNESYKKEELLKENEIQIQSFKFEIEAANNREEARELLIQKLKEEKEKLENESYKSDELLKTKEMQIESVEFELEAANEREEDRESLIKKLKEFFEEFKNVSDEKDDLLKKYKSQIKSANAELEAANKKDDDRELLIKKLKEEMEELKNVSDVKDDLLEEYKSQMKSAKAELEAANKKEEALESSLINNMQEQTDELENVSYERDESLKEYENQIASMRLDIESAKKREEAREILIKELEEEKDKLMKVSNGRNELLKTYEIQIISIKLELEGANNNLKHERKCSALAACDIHHIEGVLKNREFDLLNAMNEIRKLTQQVRQNDLASNISKSNPASNAESARSQKQLHHAEREMKKYQTKYRDTKAKLREAKMSFTNLPTENETNHGFQEPPVYQLANDFNANKSKTELLMDLLPTVNIIHENDLKPVIRGGKQVILGNGAFSQVSLMKCIPTNTLVAVKTIFNSAPDGIILEGRAMQLCSAHPSFPVMLGIVRNTEGTPIKLVSTFIGDHASLKSVSLRSAISENFIISINKDSLKSILLDVSVGISYLHKNNIVHNDIKSENILLDYEHHQWVVKIIDLGGITSPLVEPPAAEAAYSDISAFCMVMCELAETTKWQKLNELAIKCKKTRPTIDDVILLLSVLGVC